MTPEEFQHQAQQAMAAGWDCVRSLPADQPERAVALLGALDELDAQLAGLRLKLCHEARYTESAVVVDAVSNTVPHRPPASRCDVAARCGVGGAVPVDQHGPCARA